MNTTTASAPTPGEDPQTDARHRATESAVSAHDTPRPAADGEPSIDLADEWGDESFPASDPPQSWAGPDTRPARHRGAPARPTSDAGTTPRSQLHPDEDDTSGNADASDTSPDGQLSESASLPPRAHPSDIAEAAPNEAESMPDGHPGEVPS